MIKKFNILLNICLSGILFFSSTVFLNPPVQASSSKLNNEISDISIIKNDILENAKDTKKDQVLYEKILQAANASTLSYSYNKKNVYSQTQLKDIAELQNDINPSGEYFPFGVKNEDPDGVACTAIIDNKETIVIAFHGTATFRDVITDIKFAKEKCSFLNNHGVHGGFLQRYNQLKIQVFQLIFKLKKKHPGADIIFTGHSLGGAVATLAMLDSHQYFKEKVSLITFASPRVLSKEAANYAEKLLFQNQIIRIWRANDFVPAVISTFFNFQHIGESWIIDKHSPNYSIRNNHTLANMRDCLKRNSDPVTSGIIRINPGEGQFKKAIFSIENWKSSKVAI